MNLRPVSRTLIVAAMASVFMGVVVAQDLPSRNESVRALEESLFMDARLRIQAERLRIAIQSLEELRINSDNGDGTPGAQQRLLSEFQEMSERYVALNQSYHTEFRPRAEAARRALFEATTDAE